MKRILIVLILAVLGKGLSYAQPAPIVFSSQIYKPAYAEEVVVKTSGIKSYGQANQLPAGQSLLQRIYLDGLGRSMQQISVGVGNSAKPDIVSFSVYDSYGRETKQYLPYAAASTSRALQTGVVAAQTAFYATSTTTGKYAKDDIAYAESEFDSSPLNQVLRQGAVGTAWQLSTGKVQAGLHRTMFQEIT